MPCDRIEKLIARGGGTTIVVPIRSAGTIASTRELGAIFERIGRDRATEECETGRGWTDRCVT